MEECGTVAGGDTIAGIRLTTTLFVWVLEFQYPSVTVELIFEGYSMVTVLGDSLPRTFGARHGSRLRI